MSNKVDVAILDSLLDRIERDPQSGKWRVQGPLSQLEMSALQRARDNLAKQEPKSPSSGAPDSADGQTEIKPPRAFIELDLTALEISGVEHKDVVVCLDFGTAMSKAMAYDIKSDQLLELAIGQRAGQTYPVFSLASSVYITDSGQVLFGQRAIAESTHASHTGRRRLDSIKDILCKDVISNLDDAPLERAFNPTNVSLTKAEIVTLFLAYLTDTALDELTEKYGYSRYVRRRFTRPVLPPERAVWAEDQLKILLARAQIIADSLHGKWRAGISISDAKNLLERVRGLECLPEFLVDQALMEPVAAVNSRVRHFESTQFKRRLLSVIDVGAGTIDFATFVQVHRPDEVSKYWEIPGSLEVLRQAGDTIDKMLMKRILEKAGAESTDQDYLKISSSLSLRIRQYKEDLFNTGEIVFQLENDSTGTLSIDEFCTHESLAKFEQQVHAKFEQALSQIDPTWLTVAGGVLPVVFTGGGANLPMLQSLADRQIVIHGHPLDIRRAAAIPSWIAAEYPSLEPEYPQLAVAIGGAHPELPEIGPTTSSEFGGLEADGWTIPPAYKGS